MEKQEKKKEIARSDFLRHLALKHGRTVMYITLAQLPVPPIVSSDAIHLYKIINK
jgi:hypothetical protein